MFLSAVTNISAPELSLTDICLRLLCALVVGIVIGTEREYTHRPAGMRTHMLVSLGACVVAIIGQMLFVEYSAYGATPDPARLSAQVITGVGFLGAGTIMREGSTVKGLTTAASLWAVACLGIAAGSGYYILALAGMVFIFLTLTIFETIQRRLLGAHRDANDYTVTTSDIAEGLRVINASAMAAKAEISSIQADRLEDRDGYQVTFRAEFPGMRALKRRQKFFEKLSAADAILSVRTEAAAGAET